MTVKELIEKLNQYPLDVEVKGDEMNDDTLEFENKIYLDYHKHTNLLLIGQ